MKFIIDANLPYSLTETFRKAGHEAIHIYDINFSASDEEIFDYANKNKGFVVTKDLGFADSYIREGGFGLILLRVPYYFTAQKINKVVEDFLKEFQVAEMINHIVVVELGRFRSKKI